MAGFLGAVSRLGGGSLVAQAISLAAMPLITRLYGTDAFGVFAVYMAVTGVLFPVATLRLNSAMLLPRSEQQAAGLCLAASVSTLLFAAIIAPPVVLLVLASTDFGDSGSNWVLWLIPLGVLVQGLLQNLQFAALRQQRFSTMALGSISESVGDRGTSILIASVNNGPAGLVAGRIIGPLANAVILGRQCLPSLLDNGLFNPRPYLVRRLVRRYRRFPLFSSWAFLFGNGSREAPVVILALLQPASIVGAYALGVRVLNWPILLIGDAVAKVFLQRMAAGRHDRDMHAGAASDVLRYSSYLMLPPMVILALFGDRLFAFVFGPNWELAGVFCQILSASYFSAFLYRVFSAFFDVFERQKERLAFDITLFVARCAGLLVGNWLGGLYGALIGLLATSVVVHAIGLGYLLGLVEISFRSSMRLAASIVATLLPILGCAIATWFYVDSVPETAICLLAGAAAQLVVFYMRDENLRGILQSLRETRR